MFEKGTGARRDAGKTLHFESTIAEIDDVTVGEQAGRTRRRHHVSRRIETGIGHRVEGPAHVTSHSVALAARAGGRPDHLAHFRGHRHAGRAGLAMGRGDVTERADEFRSRSQHDTQLVTVAGIYRRVAGTSNGAKRFRGGKYPPVAISCH